METERIVEAVRQYRPGQIVRHNNVSDDSVKYRIIKKITEETEYQTTVWYRVREIVCGRPTATVLRFDDGEIRGV
jgi:hypothetical protein